MEELIKFGFHRIGHWRLDDCKPVFQLQVPAKVHRSLYAFVCANTVKYVGKTVKPIAHRMYQYQNPGPTQSTNIRNYQFIAEILKQGQSIEVYILADTHKLQYANVPINLAAGLEDGLIDHFQPEWNMIGKKTKKPKAKKTINGCHKQGSRYKKLGQYLKTLKKSSTIVYEDIEKIIGGKLPESAYRYKAWWANGGHCHSRIWQEAGWRVSNVHLGKSVSFEPIKERQKSQDGNNDSKSNSNGQSLESEKEYDVKLITQKDIQALLAYIPYFESGKRFGRYAVVDKGAIGYATLSKHANLFMHACYKHNVVQNIDWGAWANKNEALVHEGKGIESLSLEEVCKLLMTHCRADRFCDGHLLSVMENGQILRILKRLKDICNGEKIG